MTKQSIKSPKKYDVGDIDPFTGLSNLNEDLLESYLLASQKFFDNAFAFNEELMRFVGHRLEKDMNAFQALSQCKSGDEVVSLQTDFIRTTAEDYQTEVAKLVEQGTEALKGFSGETLHN